MGDVPAWARATIEFVARPIRLPGWLAFILAVFSYIPDWKARWDFWVGLFISASGLPHVIETILASPFLGLGLIVVGFVYLLYVQGVVRIHPWPNAVPLYTAARILYETVEKSGITNSIVGVPYSSPDVALDHFIYVLLSSDAALSGVRPPSTKSMPISRVERTGLKPVSGTSGLRYLRVASGVGYDEVTVNRRDLARVAQRYIEMCGPQEAT